MQTHTTKESEIRSVAVRADSVLASASPLLDHRPEVAQLKKARELADMSVPRQQLAQLQQLAHQRGLVQRKYNPSNSVKFQPSNEAKQAFEALEKEVQSAEEEAERDVTNGSTSAYTAHQIVYSQRPTPANWGYCVEEKLNIKAAGQGWDTQVRLAGARPDYGRFRVASFPTAKDELMYADLTTELQSGGTGQHITDKLNKVDEKLFPQNTKISAADITHNGKNPLSGQPPQKLDIKGVTQEHLDAYSAYRDFEASGEWTPGKGSMLDSWGNISSAGFVQWPKKQRDTFTREWNSAQEMDEAHLEDFKSNRETRKKKRPNYEERSDEE